MRVLVVYCRTLGHSSNIQPISGRQVLLQEDLKVNLVWNWYDYVQDETLGNDQALGAKDGNFYIKGGAGLEVGEWVLRDNEIRIKDPTRDVYIGSLGATADVVFNRAIRVQTGAGRTSFQVSREGLVKISTPNTILTNQSAFEIVGSSTGVSRERNFTGTLLQLTAQDNTPARVSMDAFGIGATTAYAVIAARQARGHSQFPPLQHKQMIQF